MKKKLKANMENVWTKWKGHTAIRILLFIFLGGSLYLLLLSNISPELVEVTINSRAEHDILSPATVTDEEATYRSRQRASSEVDPVFTKEDSITENQIRHLDRIFSQIKEIVGSEEFTGEEKLEALQQRIPFSLTDEAYAVLISLPTSDIETLRAITSNIVYQIMSAGVREQNNGLDQAHQQVDDSLILSSLNTDVRMVSREIARVSIIPNYVINQEETDLLRQEAFDGVRNIEIREGEIIVQEGDVITNEAYRKLALVGLLSDTANNRPFLGLAIFILLIVSFISFYIPFSSLPLKSNNKQLLMYIIIFLLNVAMLKVVSIGQTLNYSGFGFMAPVAFATMLITMLLHQRLAVFSSFIFGIIAAVILNGESSAYMDFNYGLVTVFAGATGAFFLGKAARKTKILQAGFFVSAVSMLAILTVSLLKPLPVAGLEMLQYVLFGLMSGLIASVLAIGLLPFFEASFRILSSVKLIELSNPNHPLLRKVLMEAPGTYHHSVMVANLAEAAAEAIGANGLLARVGAYYHDVGKTKRPHFFIENQMNMGNPHDKISPHLSATIITAHATDGAQMLKEHQLPKAIQDIAAQHHGTTLLKYFYHKAKQDQDAEVRESDFRYVGPKAQFKESAVVGIADCIEAAVRSISKPSPERIENMVRNIIKDRLDDGQFNECDLTLKELDIIVRTMCETLKGIFHSRIEYPEDSKSVALPKESMVKKKEHRNISS